MNNDVNNLMKLLARDVDNGKFGGDSVYSDFNVIEDDYDDSYDYDDDMIIIDDEEDEYYDEEEDLIVVDNCYVPDEYEEDLFDNKFSRKNSEEDDVSIFDISKSDEDPYAFEELLSKNETHHKRTKNDKAIIDDKISKNIAKDINNSEVKLINDNKEESDWISDDMFGNDISKIIVEEEPLEKETYSKGEFSDWAKSKKTK